MVSSRDFPILAVTFGILVTVTTRTTAVVIGKVDSNDVNCNSKTYNGQDAKSGDWISHGPGVFFLCETDKTSGKLVPTKCGCDAVSKKLPPPAYVVCPGFYYKMPGIGMTCFCSRKATVTEFTLLNQSEAENAPPTPGKEQTAASVERCPKTL